MGTSPCAANAAVTRPQPPKHLFAERYREASAAGAMRPKVLAMFGQLHLYRGRSERTEQLTLGNFLSETAVFYGARSFHFYAVVDGDYAKNAFFAPLVRLADAAAESSAAGALIDLRPAFDRARRDEAIDPRLRRLVMAFDAFLFLRDGRSGSIERLRTPHFRWYPE